MVTLQCIHASRTAKTVVWSDVTHRNIVEYKINSQEDCILDCSNQKIIIVESQFWILHNNTAVMKGNVHAIIAHAPWFVTIRSKQYI